MNIEVKFSESTSEIPVQFENLHIVTDGVPPEEVDKLVEDAKNQGIEEGYESGYSKGNADGYTNGQAEGFAAGQWKEYDRFWDEFQNFGSRENYSYGFSRWNKSIFMPKYDIRGNCSAIFHGFNENDPEWESFDMAQRLSDLGIGLYTPKNLTSAFMWAWIGRIGTIDCTNTLTLQSTFGYFKVRTIDKLIVKPENVFDNTFIESPELTNITFEGIIGNAISFQWQNKLSDASVQSVIDHLQDLTGADSKTVTFHGTVGARLTEEQKAVITAKNWTLVY